MKIIASPDTLVDNSQSVTLHVTGVDLSSDNGLVFQWRCRKSTHSNLQSNIESNVLLSEICVLLVQEETANAETTQRVTLTLLKKAASQIPLICSIML